MHGPTTRAEALFVNECTLREAASRGVATAAHQSSSAHKASAHKTRGKNPDEPSIREAMNGPERSFWQNATDSEMDNLQRHSTYEEVPEDSLPSWDPVKKRASEVVSTLWVLKKKYNELKELLKGKARCGYNGKEQKARGKLEGGISVETFSPTTRLTTWRMLCAAALVRPRVGERRTRVFDVEAAYLQGEFSAGMRVLARPPPGYRR